MNVSTMMKWCNIIESVLKAVISSCKHLIYTCIYIFITQDRKWNSI